MKIGDEFTLPDRHGTFTCSDFAAGEMLIVAVDNTTGQELHFPARYTPMQGDTIVLHESSPAVRGDQP